MNPKWVKLVSRVIIGLLVFSMLAALVIPMLS
jgi:hypothetical protein